MSLFNPKQKNTLRLICDTLAPTISNDSPLYSLSAVSLGVPDLVEEALERVTDDKAQNDLRRFLGLLENPLVNWLAAGTWGRFSELSLEERTLVLRAWGNSRLGVARQAFQGLKRLVLFITYAHTPDGKTNPSWSAFGYVPPTDIPREQPRSIQPLSITAPTTLETDVLIIGSGAGGGVAAGELTAAGHDVIVIEKGGYYAEADFDGRELDGKANLYERSGALTTADTSMVVLAGSTLGGGTTVNWMASLRPPDYVLDEWEREYGFTGASSPAFQASLDAISQRINVNTDESIVNGQNGMLDRACRSLGYEVDVIPRNVRGCEDCGFCEFGCRYGAKQGTLRTYLQDAYDRGARIIVRAEAKRITHQNGRVTGAMVSVQDENGVTYEVTIKAKAVVVAAGSIHTPALLLRSGLSNPNIGANLHLHPVTTTTGQYEEPIVSWQGAPMSRIFKQFDNVDGRGYGWRVEVPPAHPGVIASSLPWQSAQQHRDLMKHIRHFANFIVLVRDYYAGQVKVDKRGQPVLHYKLHPFDANHLMQGMLTTLRMHCAAGAKIIYAPHNRYLYFRTDSGNLDTFLGAVEAQGFQPNAYALFSAHQMSSCRIAGDIKRGVLKPNGESYEIQNLFVADGSILPTASGVNPMLTIMGTAHFVIQQVKAQLS